ncbi:hypothetical protein KR059_004386 [Drosophila kikkawai]|nr:hypothetical protein KR059_004386 [Drosophila kikkawai]
MEQLITTNLQERKSRALGYRLLICYLKKANIQISEINVRHWLTKILESSYSELRKHAQLIFTALSLLISKMQSDVNLSKTFASSYLSKLFDMLSHHRIYESEKNIVSLLLTIKQCLIYYPKAIKTGITSIEKLLISLLDNKNSDIIHQSGECWLLLKNIPGNTSSGKSKGATLWRDYQLSLIKSLYYFLNSEFNNTDETFESCFIVNSFEHFTLEVKQDPFDRSEMVFQRIFNLIEFLKITLSKPLINTKYICTQQILGLIKYGLSAKIHQRNNARIDEKYFETFLPEMHVKLMELLEILIDICNTHLRMDFRNVLNILMDALEITKSPLKEGHQFRFCKLRTTVYRVVSIWCLTLKEGSHSEIISEAVIKEIMIDLMPRTQNSFSSIKRHKQHLGEVFLMLDVSIGNEDNNMLRQQAYFCLQQLLSSSGHMIKKYFLQDVHNTLLDISIQMLSNQMTKPCSSGIWNDRLELYKFITFLSKSRYCGCPTPVEIIISLMGAFRLCDNSIELSQNAYFEALEQLIHSHKSDIYFKENFTDNRYLNSANENVRTKEQSLSKISSLQNSNQLLSNQIEEEDKIDNLSRNSSESVILNANCSLNADLMIMRKQELNTIRPDNNSLNRSISFGNGFDNDSKQITARENEVTFLPLSNDVKNAKQNVEDTWQILKNKNLKKFEKNEISLKTSNCKDGSDDIMIAELEASFVSELK